MFGHSAPPSSLRNSFSWAAHNGASDVLMTPQGTRSSSEEISSLPPLTSEEMSTQLQNGSFGGPTGLQPRHPPFSHSNAYNLPYEPRFGSGYFNSPVEAVATSNTNAPSEPSSGRPSTSSTVPEANSIDSEQGNSEDLRASALGRPLWGSYSVPTYPRTSMLPELQNTTLPPTHVLPPYTTSNYPCYFPPSLPTPTRNDIPPPAPGSDSYTMSTDSSFVKEEDNEEAYEESPRPQRRYTSSRSGGNSRAVSSPNGPDPLFERHRGTGRKKIDIKPIPTKLKRQITFSKRKTGLLKKVRELTTLTQTEALVILVSETGNPHTFATQKFVDMIRRNDCNQLNQFLEHEDTKRAKSK